MADSRETALQILHALLEEKNLSSSVRTAAADHEEDNAFITMLVLTALRHLVYIRKILKNMISRKLSRQNAVCRTALILGTTELLYMQTPDYAVINSYVNLVKQKTDRYIAGFANAVLRKISREKENLVHTDTGEFFPQSFRTLLRQDYSAKTVDAIEAAAIIEPRLDITCIDASSTQKLGGQILPLGTIRLTGRGRINLLPDYDKGTWWVQDFSSSLPVKMLDNLADKNVLELCAAPGGKTAQLLNAGARVTCLDISRERLKILEENLNRLHLTPEQVICCDGLTFLEQTNDKYDIVILDAPCSATGTLRRHPEIVHLKTSADVAAQAALQKQFLQHIGNVLNQNGILLYCTCSLCRDEGENQINSFLKEHQEFKIINLRQKIPPEISAIVTDEGFIRVLPQHLASLGGADGFFIACLQKVK